MKLWKNLLTTWTTVNLRNINTYECCLDKESIENFYSFSSTNGIPLVTKFVFVTSPEIMFPRQTWEQEVKHIVLLRNLMEFLLALLLGFSIDSSAEQRARKVRMTA